MNSTSVNAKPLTDQQRLTLRHLVQHVARTFFDVEQIVALDQLAKHDVCVARSFAAVPQTALKC